MGGYQRPAHHRVKVAGGVVWRATAPVDGRHQRWFGKLPRGAMHLLDRLKGREDDRCSLASVVQIHEDK
jgi:hypothetical protein